MEIEPITAYSQPMEVASGPMEDVLEPTKSNIEGCISSSDDVHDQDFELDEVMEFMRYSVKKDSTFEGAILFKFKNDKGQDQSSYLVHISDTKGM